MSLSQHHKLIKELFIVLPYLV